MESRSLCESIQAHGHKDVRYVPDLQSAVTALQELATPQDVILTLGAGNVYQVGEAFLAGADA